MEDGSEALDNPAYEKFAQGCAKGYSFARAYREAGYVDDGRNAHRLWTKNDDIKARAAYLRKVAFSAFKMDQEEAMQLLSDIARNEAGDTEYRDRLSALKLAGSWGGWEKGTQAESKAAESIGEWLTRTRTKREQD